jgi:hypothetical protein
MFGSMVIYGGTLAVANGEDEVSAKKRQQPSHSAADVAAEDPQDTAQSAADSEDSGTPDDYIPTFFDGHGGIAGVELTQEQRDALVKEAIRRGMTGEEARELAYGADNVGEDEYSDDEVYYLASGKLYRQLSPYEAASFDSSSQSESGTDRAAGGAKDNQAASESKKTTTKSDNAKSNKKSDEGESSKTKSTPPEEDKSFKDAVEDSVREVVPDPIEDAVESLPDGLSPFRMFMTDISLPGTEPEYTVVTLDVDHDDVVEALRVTATAQVSESMTVTAEVVAPVEESPEAPPCTVAVTLTDPATDEVISAPEPVVVDDPQDVSQAAIGAIVDTVVDAAQSETSATAEIPIEAVSTVAEAQDEAEAAAPVDEPEPSEPETVDNLGVTAREEEVESSLALAS